MRIEKKKVGVRVRAIMKLNVKIKIGKNRLKKRWVSKNQW